MFWLIARFARTIETNKDGIRYFLDTNDLGVSLRVFVDGSFEERAMDDILALVEAETSRRLEGGTFIDIGANIGTTTALAIKKYGAARVVAFEPEERNHELLQMLLVANNLQSQVKAHRVALSSEDGTATMELSGDNAGDHRVRSGTGATALHGEGDRATSLVPMARLDSFDIDFAEVSLVWMDVQGHEGHVLAGGSSLLASGVPILCEYHPYMLQRAGGFDLFHSIVEKGFRNVVDVRRAVRLPAKQVRQLAESYPPPNSFTDLLLLH